MLKKILLSLTLCFTSALWAKGDPMIEQVINDYFEGYQNADVTLIKRSFHSDTRLLSVDQGKLDVTEMKDWIKNLEDRKARGDIRKGDLKIIFMDVKDYTASVKLQISFSKFEFTDYLSLLKVEEKWIVVGKIYHFQEK